MRWILYVHFLLVLSIQWICRNRGLDLLCMPMHRIGSFHFSLTCYSLYCSCILYPSSALIFSPLGIVGLEIRGRLIKSKLFSSLISLAEAISARSPWYFRVVFFRGFHHAHATIAKCSPCPCDRTCSDFPARCAHVVPSW